jgi:hypothetical protein
MSHGVFSEREIVTISIIRISKFGSILLSADASRRQGIKRLVAKDDVPCAEAGDKIE